MDYGTVSTEGHGATETGAPRLSVWAVGQFFGKDCENCQTYMNGPIVLTGPVSDDLIKTNRKRKR